MSQHGATLQILNQELVKCLESLKQRRMDILEVINREEEQYKVLQKDIQKLMETMRNLNHNLESHKVMLKKYDDTINQTELGFKKILESSETLLQVAQHDFSILSSCELKPSYGQ